MIIALFVVAFLFVTQTWLNSTQLSPGSLNNSTSENNPLRPRAHSSRQASSC